jgi:hypothetical protein
MHMLPGQIDERKFAEMVLAEFPELQEDFDEWHGLEHLQMMEFWLLTEKALNRSDWNTIGKCLRLADNLLEHGNSAIKNAVYVSYLERFPRNGEVHNRVREMMSPHLRQGWDDILAYLKELLGDTTS